MPLSDHSRGTSVVGNQEDAEASKQASKALKCVAFTNMQVSDMMYRKYERLEHRIKAISEEIDLLKADLTENQTNQRERRQQLCDIEDDIEKAQVLGNSVIVEELREEMRVLQEEGKREAKLYEALQKAVRSRRAVKKQFLNEKDSVEEELRGFNKKQQLIQILLSTCTRQSSLSNTQSSSDSQSECGGSDNEDASNGGFAVEAVAESRQRSYTSRSIDIPSSPTSEADYSPMRVRRWSSAVEMEFSSVHRMQETRKRALSSHGFQTTSTFQPSNNEV